jgi:hypothetical protein
MKKKIGRNYFQLKKRLKGLVNMLSQAAASFMSVVMLILISTHGKSGHMGKEAVSMVFNILCSC